ncbi:MAG: peptidylprolyl isomerase [Saprospiraceae bacterium]|nr:peptidylprolyl isomerase [Saprospiraceae bacterium]
MCKRILLLSALLWTAFSSMAQTEVIDKVVAQVGSELVLLSEIEEQFALVSAQQSGLPPDARCYILDNILAQKLLVNQAKIDSVLITDEEVDAQLDARIDQILDYMGGDVNQFEDYYGQTVSQVKDRFRDDLQSQILAERMRGQIISTIKVTPAEVKAFFERIPTDSLPYFNSEVEYSELVIKPKINAEERQKAIEKLEDIRHQILVDGADFGALATKFSDDFASGRIGGDLGWTRRGKFVPDFEAAAYNLDVDQISDVVETEFGFHIIQLIGRRGNTIHTRHILIRPEITQEDLDLTVLRLDSIRSMIINDTMPFNNAVKKYGYKDVQSFSNDGRVVNPSTGNTFFEIGDLEPDIFFALDTMKVGSISKPFAYRSPTGETMYRVISLVSRTVPHRASLKLDYSRIQAAAIEEKQARFINEWIMDKIDATYIEIDPMYLSCEIINGWIEPN